VGQFAGGEMRSVVGDFPQAEQVSRRCCCHQYYPLERLRLLSPDLLRYSTIDRWVHEWNSVPLRQQVGGLVLNQYDFALGVVAAYAAAAAAAVVVVAAYAAVAVVDAAAVAVVVVAVAVAAAAVVVAVVVVAAAVAVVAVVVVAAAVAVVVAAAAAVAALDASVQCVLDLVHVDPELRVLGGLVPIISASPFPASRALASLEFLSLSLYPCLYS
jgi:hypothetical protein